MKLSEIKGDKALDMLADLMDPSAEIMSDKDFAIAMRNKKTSDAVKIVLRNHKKSITQILAIMDDVDPSKYEVRLVTLPLKIVELLNDPYLLNLFTSQGQEIEEESSGSATENIGGVR